MRVEKAFPAIVSRAKFNRVNALMRSRAPKITHPRRVASTYLLSGLLKCRACRRAFSGQEAKSGQFAYYVCQSIMKRGKDACEAPRLNARRFEEMVLERIRANVLTEGIGPVLAEIVEEEMDGVGREQRKRLQTIEYEIEEVKRKLARVWHVIETTDRDVADAADRIREHRERRERLEDAATDASAIISQRRTVQDDVEAVAACARNMGEFLRESEMSERRAFVTTFVKEIVVRPGSALVRYTIPISQSTRKAQVLVGGGSEEFRVGDAADAYRQLYARAASCRHLLKLGKFRQLNHSNW